MIYFPQLSTGATCQFPIRKRCGARTILNRSREGYSIKLADPGAAITEWHLSFDELTDQELAALEALFQASEGRLGEFTFLDPIGNLLAWSEQQDEAIWQKDPLLSLIGGLADPFGGTAAFRLVNTAAATQVLRQTVDAPASLTYCLSLYARSDQGASVRLVRGSAADSRQTGTQWTRLISSGGLSNGAEAIDFGIALDPGCTVDVFGFQVEAQVSASSYKKTADKGGVYPKARFRDDALTVTTIGPNRHSCELDIFNAEHL